MEKEKDPEQPNLNKLAIVTLAGVLILGGAVYGAYRYSQRQTSNIILPGGITYLGPSPTANPTSSNKPTPADEQPPTAPIRFTADANVTWNTHTGRLFPYSFSYPSTLPLVVFPSDNTDSVAISWGNIPPQQNILLNIELLDQRDASFTLKPKIEYVKIWYKFFSGLKGLAKVDRFTNANGLKGYKASYINYANASPNVDIFFEIPNQANLMIHLANGILDPNIFERIIHSLKWTPATPTHK